PSGLCRGSRSLRSGDHQHLGTRIRSRSTGQRDPYDPKIHRRASYGGEWGSRHRAWRAYWRLPRANIAAETMEGLEFKAQNSKGVETLNVLGERRVLRPSQPNG